LELGFILGLYGAMAACLQNRTYESALGYIYEDIAAYFHFRVFFLADSLMID